MANKKKNFASSVIYVHNAANRIADFLKTIMDVMEYNFEHHEIICVNDFSDDNSLEIIKKVSENSINSIVSVVNMSYFHGLEFSMNAGVDLSIGDFVFEFDNTYLDFDPTYIMKIYYHSLKGYDIVSASANRNEKLTSKLFYEIFDRYTDQSCKMTTESFRVLSRRALNKIDSINKTIPYRKIIYANCGFKTDNMKYQIVNNIAWTFDKKEKNFRSRLAIDSLILFTKMGYSFSKVITILMMCISIFMIVYSIVTYATANPIEGWTTTILFLSIVFFGLFGILTIVIKYLQILLDLVFKRQPYSFESIEKLTK